MTSAQARSYGIPQQQGVASPKTFQIAGKFSSLFATFHKNASKFFQKSGSLSKLSQPPNISNSLKLLGSRCFRNLANANTRTLQISESVRHCCKLPKRRSFTSIQNSNTPLQIPKLTRRATMKASFRAGRNTQTTRSLKHKSSGKDRRNLVPVIFLMFFASRLNC